MLQNVNAEFSRKSKGVFCHFSQITDERPGCRKYASFEGGISVQNACYHRLFDKKKALMQSARFSFFGEEKGGVSVQNVKN